MKFTIFAFSFSVLFVSQFLLTTHYSLPTSNAQGPNNPVSGFFNPQYAPPLSKLGDVGGSGYGLAEKLVNWLIGIFWIVAVGFVIWAAFTFLFADGDENEIGDAKNRLKYALIAAMVALLATGIKPITRSLLRGDTYGGGGGGFGSECVSYSTEEQCGNNSNCEWNPGLIPPFGCEAKECNNFGNSSDCNARAQCEWVSNSCETIYTKCATNRYESTCNLQSFQCHWENNRCVVN